MKNKNQINNTKKKINSFRHLPADWHYGSDITPQAKVLDMAIRLNQCAGLMGFEATDAFPDIEGGVMITVYSGDIYLEFSIEVDGLISYIREQGDKEVDSKQKISPLQAINYIVNIGLLKLTKQLFYVRLVY